MKGKGMGRPAACAALLTVLAISGYLGASRKETPVQTVSVPVVFETVEESGKTAVTIKETRADFDDQRERALTLLEEVISSSKASQRAAQDALEQKMKIAAAMESEARLEEALDHLGIPEAKAVSGEGMMSVFVPAAAALDDKARVQIVDAAATAAGLSADRIKIILAKNE